VYFGTNFIELEYAEDVFTEAAFERPDRPVPEPIIPIQPDEPDEPGPEPDDPGPEPKPQPEPPEDPGFPGRPPPPPDDPDRPPVQPLRADVSEMTSNATLGGNSTGGFHVR